MYKIPTGKEDVNKGDWFTLAREGRRGVNTRITDGFLNLLKPELKKSLDLRCNFFSVRVVDPWNNLPNEVKEAETVNTFKNRYDRHISSDD